MDALFLKLLKLFEKLGLWKDGVELIGSWSFLLYQRHLGVRPLPLRTQDVDFLLPWPYPTRSTVGLSDALSELGFRSASNPDGSNYFVHPDLKLEFLSPERGKGGLDARAIKPLGVRAVTLRFMDMLLKDSIFVDEGRIRVRVPKPLNFCLHKFVIAQVRDGRGAARAERSSRRTGVAAAPNLPSASDAASIGISPHRGSRRRAARTGSEEGERSSPRITMSGRRSRPAPAAGPASASWTRGSARAPALRRRSISSIGNPSSHRTTDAMSRSMSAAFSSPICDSRGETGSIMELFRGVDRMLSRDSFRALDI